jgi:hypothetical protein
MRGWVLAALTLALPSRALAAPGISNGRVAVRAVAQNGVYTGFDLLARGRTAAVVRLSSSRLVVAGRCTASKDSRRLIFDHLQARVGTGLRLGRQDRVTVALEPADPYPRVAFDLTVAAFDPARWETVAGKEPFHFLVLYLRDAEAWHQRGWLNATPRADPFPLLLDRHAGTPEISAYPYNRNWSYTPPLGAHPLPVIGLWAPRSRQYAGFEFQSTRLEDNSEKEVATGYCWNPASETGRRGDGATGRTGPVREDAGQFVALVYPYGGRGYQQLLFPPAGSHIASHGTLLWSLDLDAASDPNRFVWSYLWAREQGRLPRVPAGVDLSWLPGGIRLRDFEGPPSGGLIAGVEGHFQVPGTRLINGWDWHGESPTAVAERRGDTARLRALEETAAELMRHAQRFQVDGDSCVYWEKPLAGQWTEEWGGRPVTTRHNANGFAAGRLFLGLYRDRGRKEYLPVVDGVLNWARHIAWTRNEFADVPSSPFAIGGTLSASFCLDYYETFRNAADAAHRRRARQALDLARSFTFRYMVMWPSDNNRADGLGSAFLWEPNSGRDWTGAACANEVFWNLDTLAQTAVHTGDPVLMWALQGSLSRWYLLYQDVSRPSLAQYQAGDMAEGYGLYAGNVYGVGRRAPYGFSAPLAMTEPVGSSTVRVLAGERAAMVFNKEGVHTTIRDYRYTPPGSLSFTPQSRLPRFDLSLTVPYVDISRKPLFIVRGGRRVELAPGSQLIRPPQALWSLMIRGLQSGDHVILGAPDARSPILPSTPPLAQTSARPAGDESGSPSPPLAESVPLPYDTVPDTSWDHLDSWAGLPRGQLWTYGVPFALAPTVSRSIVTHPTPLARPLAGAGTVVLAYSAGSGPLPALRFADGTRATVDAALEALMWRGWPPVYTARLLVAPVRVSGKRVTGIDPGGRAVWALTALPGSPPPALRQGAMEWQRERRSEQAIAQLGQEVGRVREGTFAVLPPEPRDTTNLLIRAGLPERGVRLTPDQLVDPAFFNPRRFPAALYADGEEYLDTVHSPGDAAGAVERYVHEGGTLLLLAPGPFPMYYAQGPGMNRPAPLPNRLGLPLTNAIETMPEDRLTLVRAPDEAILDGIPASLPYPSGDPRLRSVDRQRLPAGARYQPIYTVQGAGGRSYGDAAGLVELPQGQGKMLYVWGGLLRDPEHDFPIAEAAVRYLAGITR